MKCITKPRVFTTIISEEEIDTVHGPLIYKLIKKCENSSTIKEKVIAIYELYKYIYEILSDFKELNDITICDRIIKITIKKIPEIIEQCIKHINYNNVKPYIKCIEQMTKLNQLANEIYAFN